jgi:hypothetical protein
MRISAKRLHAQINLQPSHLVTALLLSSSSQAKA